MIVVLPTGISEPFKHRHTILHLIIPNIPNLKSHLLHLLPSKFLIPINLHYPVDNTHMARQPVIKSDIILLFPANMVASSNRRPILRSTTKSST